MKKIKKTFYKKIFFVLLLIISVYVFIKFSFIKHIIYVLLLSFILSYSLRPIYRILIKKGLSNRFSAILILMTLIGFFVLSFAVIVPTMLREGKNFSGKLNDIDKVVTNLYSKIDINNNKILYLTINSLNEKINRELANFSTEFFDDVLSIGENIISLAIVPVISYYFLIDEEIIGNKILTLFPVKKRAIIKNIFNDIDKVLGRYILTQFVLSIIIGVLTFIVLIFFKVDLPFLLSLINAVFNIIPYFGPIFGAIPAIFMAVLGSTQKAIWVALCLYLIQQLEGDIISPKIIGENISMHPVIVMLLLIVGGKIGGFLGMVLAVPIGVIIKVLYEDINYYLF